MAVKQPQALEQKATVKLPVWTWTLDPLQGACCCCRQEGRGREAECIKAAPDSFARSNAQVNCLDFPFCRERAASDKKAKVEKQGSISF